MKTKDEQIQELLAICAVNGICCQAIISVYEEDTVAYQQAKHALTNSPAAAQELVDENKRMREALKELASVSRLPHHSRLPSGSVPTYGRQVQEIALDALSTTQQPTQIEE